MRATAPDSVTTRQVTDRQLQFGRRVRNWCLAGAVVAVATCVLARVNFQLIIAVPALTLALGLAVLLLRIAADALRHQFVFLTFGVFGRHEKPTTYWTCVAFLLAAPVVIVLVVVYFVRVFANSSGVA
jgi:hypothetical protein